MEYEIRFEDKGLKAHAKYRMGACAEREFERLKTSITHGWVELLNKGVLVARHYTAHEFKWEGYKF
jgi:hypothetical protein